MSALAITGICIHYALCALNSFKAMLEIRQDIVDVLDADGQTDGVGLNAASC